MSDWIPSTYKKKKQLQKRDRCLKNNSYSNFHIGGYKETRIYIDFMLIMTQVSV